VDGVIKLKQVFSELVMRKLTAQNYGKVMADSELIYL
jgi:hypothetical protein